jgi:hypothetical protein
MLVSCSGCSRGISGFASRMDTQLPEQREEDVQALLQDVLAFIDTCEDAAPSVRRGGPLKGIGDCAPKRRSTGRYSPDYERSRREKKKKEREGLRAQVAQYEAQLELLKLQTARPSREAKWGWVDEATEDELKRRSAEELNRQLRGILVQQVNAVKKLGGLLDQEAAFAKVRRSCGLRRRCSCLSNGLSCAASAGGVGRERAVRCSDPDRHVLGPRRHRRALEGRVFSSSGLVQLRVWRVAALLGGDGVGRGAHVLLQRQAPRPHCWPVH